MVWKQISDWGKNNYSLCFHIEASRLPPHHEEKCESRDRLHLDINIMSVDFFRTSMVADLPVQKSQLL